MTRDTTEQHPNPHDLRSRLEALFIVADQPLAPVELATVLDTPVAQVQEAIARLREEYEGPPQRGFELREVGGGYRLYARAEFDPLIEQLVGEQSVARLSQAALETLTVIAYRQPISRGQVAQIRAVNVDSVVRTLLTRGLITEVDQDPDTGATRYGTTPVLLEHLGIASLDALPQISPLLEDGSEGFADESRA